jgi:hypothetical protein
VTEGVEVGIGVGRTTSVSSISAGIVVGVGAVSVTGSDVGVERGVAVYEGPGKLQDAVMMINVKIKNRRGIYSS